MPYKVKLDAFEGPLDLLLFLIKKHELDIYDIPIARITRQYLEYIDIIKLFDIEAASDFILMAATLMRIKSQMLLPKPEVDEELDEVDDPRQELVYRLLEYKRFKDAAETLAVQEAEERRYYPRGHFRFNKNQLAEPLDFDSDVTLFDLVAAFKKVIETNTIVPIHHVQDINVNLEEQIRFVMDQVESVQRLEFSMLFTPQDDKMVWIVTFVAILELIRSRQIRVSQDEPFGTILISKAKTDE